MSPFGLYIHWPFCLSKCPYCDFNSHVRENIDQKRWQRALLSELENAAQAGQGKELVSIFFGGGTPSLMAPETASLLIERAHSLFSVSKNLEVTLEANPSTVEAGRFKAFAQAGVNRLSLGVQSLNDEALAFLGRRHNAKEALKALEIAKIFPKYSFDLIYALPDQNLMTWRRELKEALTYAKGHLSLYQLTIEPQTLFATRAARGERMTPSEEQSAHLYAETEKMMREAGLPPYEVSNYASPEHECQHNILYWNVEDYIGIGPGAHGRISKEGKKWTTYRYKVPEIWLENVEVNGHGLHKCEALTLEERLREVTLMGLRLTKGLSLRRLQEETGLCLLDAFSEQSLRDLEREGLLQTSSTHVIPTYEGRLRLNSVIGHLLKTRV